MTNGYQTVQSNDKTSDYDRNTETFYGDRIKHEVILRKIQNRIINSSFRGSVEDQKDDSPGKDTYPPNLTT